MDGVQGRVSIFSSRSAGVVDVLTGFFVIRVAGQGLLPFGDGGFQIFIDEVLDAVAVMNLSHSDNRARTVSCRATAGFMVVIGSCQHLPGLKKTLVIEMVQGHPVACFGSQVAGIASLSGASSSTAWARSRLC
jgi:hypothetical protein